MCPHRQKPGRGNIAPGAAKEIHGRRRQESAGKTKRRFLPNLQRSKSLSTAKSKPCVSVKAIRTGLNQTPVKRKPFRMPNYKPPKPHHERSEWWGSNVNPCLSVPTKSARSPIWLPRSARPTWRLWRRNSMPLVDYINQLQHKHGRRWNRSHALDLHDVFRPECPRVAQRRRWFANARHAG